MLSKKQVQGLLVHAIKSSDQNDTSIAGMIKMAIGTHTLAYLALILDDPKGAEEALELSNKYYSAAVDMCLNPKLSRN